MAIAITTDSATISTTEYFLASDSTTATYQTDDVMLQVHIDTSNMAAGDEFRFRAYTKINAGSAVAAYDSYRSGAQSEPVVIPALVVGEGWEVSVQKIAGTDRSFGWSLRKVT